MLRQIVSTTIKNLKILFKDPGGLASLFLMPMMFILVMSIALQGLFNTGTDTKPITLPVFNLDEGLYASYVIDSLDGMEGIDIKDLKDAGVLTRKEAEKLIVDGTYPVVVIFPSVFSKQVAISSSDTEVAVDMITDPAVSVQYIAPQRGMVLGAVQQVVFHAASGGVQSPGISLNQSTPADMEMIVEPDTYQQNVPGYAIMGVFFIVGAMAASILTEKREGTFRRLLAAPVSKIALMVGMVLPFYLVNLLQITVMFGAAHILFGMGLGNLPALIIISLAMAAAATGLGIMVAALARSDVQVGGISSLLTITMSALGGCMMPSYIMPKFLQDVSRFVPHAWAMQGFQNVLVRGYGATEIFPETGVLLGFAALFFLIGVWRFRFE